MLYVRDNFAVHALIIAPMRKDRALNHPYKHRSCCTIENLTTLYRLVATATAAAADVDVDAVNVAAGCSLLPTDIARECAVQGDAGALFACTRYSRIPSKIQNHVMLTALVTPPDRSLHCITSVCLMSIDCLIGCTASLRYPSSARARAG